MERARAGRAGRCAGSGPHPPTPPPTFSRRQQDPPAILPGHRRAARGAQQRGECPKAAGEAAPAQTPSPSPGRAVPQTLITQTLSHANPTAITPEEYFNPNFELGNRDMGRPMELTTKTQK